MDATPTMTIDCMLQREGHILRPSEALHLWNVSCGLGLIPLLMSLLQTRNPGWQRTAVVFEQALSQRIKIGNMLSILQQLKRLLALSSAVGPEQPSAVSELMSLRSVTHSHAISTETELEVSHTLGHRGSSCVNPTS